MVAVADAKYLLVAYENSHSSSLSAFALVLLLLPDCIPKDSKLAERRSKMKVGTVGALVFNSTADIVLAAPEEFLDACDAALAVRADAKKRLM